jgi:predicted ribosome quality control (RQC) complex YloA/Tae2 family protein
MKERSLSGLELKVIVKELNNIKGSRVNKIYQPESTELYFKLYKKDTGGVFLRIKSGLGVYLTKYTEEFPMKPMAFCGQLRKMLHNAVLRDVIQRDFERIVEFVFEKGDVYRLVCELFGQGNFILTDSDYKILGLAHIREWKGRSLKRGAVYKYPKVHLTSQRKEEFESLMRKKRVFGVYEEPLEFDMFAKGKFKKFGSFNEAVDYYFYVTGKESVMKKGLAEYEKKRKKFEKVLEVQEKSVAEYKKKSGELKEKGDLIYSNFSKLEKLIKGKKAKFEFKGMVIDPKLSLSKNASKYYEDAKKFKSKISGAEKTLKETKKKLDKLEKERDKIVKGVEKKAPKEVIKIKKEWYEKFHWFYTSGGFLAIGGRDATSNEIVVKKHTDKGDLVFHADVSGSPFFVLKNGQKAKELDFKEVAKATASYSRAWGSGIKVADAYYVAPEQVSKKAPSGEYKILKLLKIEDLDKVVSFLPAGKSSVK